MKLWISFLILAAFNYSHASTGKYATGEYNCVVKIVSYPIPGGMLVAPTGADQKSFQVRFGNHHNFTLSAGGAEFEFQMVSSISNPYAESLTLSRKEKSDPTWGGTGFKAATSSYPHVYLPLEVNFNVKPDLLISLNANCDL